MVKQCPRDQRGGQRILQSAGDLEIPLLLVAHPA